MENKIMSNQPSVLRKTEPSPEMIEAMANMQKERADYAAQLPTIRRDGEAALGRLVKIAQGDSGQCRYVAGFLLGLYNGRRFPFDLTNLRGLDHVIFDDCMKVLRMDHTPLREVHTYFDAGNDEGHTLFEGLAVEWEIKDHLAGTGSF